MSPREIAEADIATAGIKTEYGQLMSGGGYHIRWDHPDAEKIYPTHEWAEGGMRFGGQVWRRRVIVVEDWKRLTKRDVERMKKAAARSAPTPRVPAAQESPH